MTEVLIKERQREIWGHGVMEERPCDDGGKDWREAATAREHRSPQSSAGGHCRRGEHLLLCQHLWDLGLSRRREPKEWGVCGVLEFGAGTKEQAALLLPTGLPLSGSGCWRRAERS